ncbi:MAG: CotH kinase family protein, partial [Verrucomicrobiales bacterium]|nr:CotH kinase family protein [Verrucomicrobiales bacterium]
MSLPVPSQLRHAYVVLSLCLFSVCACPAAPLISEFMAANDTVLADEDGAFADWIEIHNPDGVAVDLDGYYLTDDAGDLTQWRIPSVVIAPGGYLVVFASSKDRAVAGSELHTNFKLSAAGEYLALVAPDGLTVQSEIAPSYPQQDADRSFGLQSDSVPLVSHGDVADYVVPSSGELGTNWTSGGFVPVGWSSGPTGMGFGLEVPGMLVRDVHSVNTLNNLSDVDRLLAGNGILSETTVVTPVYNFLDTGSDGRHGGNRLFPDGGGDNFATVATGTLIIPEGRGGLWSFGLSSDEGGRIKINGFSVLVDNSLHAAEENFSSVSLSPGAHQFEVTSWELSGGAEAEFFARKGLFSTWNTGMRLVGDVENGGLAVFTTAESAGGGATGLVATNLSDAMGDVRTSVYMRQSFSVADVGALSSLNLNMRYNDGFVAYLNGVLVASGNAPGSPAWNSSATATRPSEESLNAEMINLTSSISLLQNGGGNVLAVHGMNRTVADDDFLVLPELRGAGVPSGDPVFFDAPTPGSVNGVPTSLGRVADTKFTPDRGFYPNAEYPSSPLSVEITTATDGASIRYTTDGSPPSETNGTLYTGPVPVSSTTTLRAVGYKQNYDSTNVDTQTYLFLDDIVWQSEAAPEGWPSGSLNGQVFNYGMDPEIVNSGNREIGGVARVKEALVEIPTISIVTDQPNLTDASTGIYTHAGDRGYAWERPASAELIFPDGYVDPDGNTEGFQVDMGIRIRGGFSRSSSNPKHSFRLFFREEYGDSKLRYPLFGDEGVNEFDNIDLRGPQNYSWAWNADLRNTFMRDVWSRDLQLEMGSPSTRSRYYHLYLNGIYWGMVMSEERPEASFAESYLGGDKSDYDVMKSFGDIADGNRDAYRRLWEIWRQGFSGSANYQRVLGNNPDGSDNPGFEKMVDLQNLIDYMIITYYTGDRDGPGSRYTGTRPNNYFGIYNRENPDGWKFVEHDSEHSMGTGDNDMTFPLKGGTALNDFNPHTLHQGLAANPEYRAAFADRVRELLYNTGSLTPENGIAILDRRVAQIDTAIIAHSARWGDGRSGGAARTRQSWQSAVSGIRGFIQGRRPVLIGQLRARGWYPAIDAPTFSLHGGYISSGEELAMTAASDTIYYYTDGRDPRSPGGSINGSPVEFVGSTSRTTFVNTGSSWKYLDDGSNQGTAWRAAGFSDAGWKTGVAEFGYGDVQTTEILYGPNSSNSENDSSDKYVTTYFRKTFDVTDAGSYDALTIELQRDDGGLVYLNGELVFNSNMPATYDYQTSALDFAGGVNEVTLFSNVVDPSLLVEGANTLAVEIHQFHTGGPVTSSDVSFDARLRGTKTTTSDPVTLPGPGEVVVKTRARDGATWSALTEATFYVDLVPASPANLAITEVHYRPAAPSAAELAAGHNDRDDFEYVEVSNVSGDHVHLLDVEFTDGVRFGFNGAATGRVLAPGARLLLVRNPAAFEFRYGAGLPVGGEYSGGLLNDGEYLRLADANGDTIHELTYNDQLPWPTAADGSGSSLVLVLPPGGGVPEHGDPRSWRPSVGVGGSPGGEDGTNYVLWKAAEGIPSDGEDRDGDGLGAVAEYALGSDPNQPDAHHLPVGLVETLE